MHDPTEPHVDALPPAPVETYPAAETAAGPRRSPAGPPRRRLPYEKPQIRTIQLMAEEVLSVGCKLDNGPGGPIGATCTAASCFSAGS